MDDVAPVLAHIRDFILGGERRPVSVVVVAEGCHVDVVPLLAGIEGVIARDELEVAVFQMCFNEEEMIFPRPLTQVVYHFEPGNLTPLAVRIGNEAVASFAEDVERVLAVMAGASREEAFLSTEERAALDRASRVFADEAELPSAFRLGRSLARQLWHTAKAHSSGIPIFVTGEEYESRFSVCLGCPHLTDGGRCVKCGCVMSLKANISAAECPVGKWGAISLGGT